MAISCLTRAIATISIVLTLAGCQSQTAAQRAAAEDIRLAGQVCDTLSPITYDGKLDTQPTKDQVKAYNAKRAAFCANPTN